jgi:hypothetical protein
LNAIYVVKGSEEIKNGAAISIELIAILLISKSTGIYITFSL